MFKIWATRYGDVFMTLICLANSHRIDLDYHWKRTIDKLYDRDTSRFEKREGRA